jgi:hypothetical protein
MQVTWDAVMGVCRGFTERFRTWEIFSGEFFFLSFCCKLGWLQRTAYVVIDFLVTVKSMALILSLFIRDNACATTTRISGLSFCDRSRSRTLFLLCFPSLPNPMPTQPGRASRNGTGRQSSEAAAEASGRPLPVSSAEFSNA